MTPYRTIQQAKATDHIGEVNEQPSMTIEGEYMEMKDILNYAMKGMDHGQKRDTQYFRPDEIQQINSLFRQSLDLTDIDVLQQKTSWMQQQLSEAQQRKQEALQKQQEEEALNNPEPQPETTE